MNDLDATSIISQEQFDRYASEWLSLSSDPVGTELTHCFELPSEKARLLALSFPVMQMVELVSAVGVRSIKARFLVVRDLDNQPHFSVALFATDAQDTRLTAYYLAERYWQPGGEQAASLRMEIANVLARHWAANWANAGRYPLAPSLFASGYGPLRGYNFDIIDFMKPLLPLQALGDQRLLLDLGLHTYFRPGPRGDAPVATFGLMLRLTGSGVQTAGADPSYDVAQPCPPTC
ncbi:MAG: hypothetical protein NVSMB30_07750 [Hymenobacter sp.]